MENILFMFNHLEAAKLDSYFLYPLAPNSGRSCEVQSLVLPIVFGGNPQLAQKALIILLNSWILFSASTVDNNKTGLLYTILYVLTWIFVCIFQKENQKPIVGLIN